MDVLILGGTGAMGMPLTRMLLELGYNVFVTSRSFHQSHGNLKYIKGDAKDVKFLRQCLTCYYNVIVDFMSYSTAEFTERVDVLLKNTSQYVFISSARVFAENKEPLIEDSPRLLDVITDDDYLKTDEYALAKARQEDILKRSKFCNWSVVRPSVTYNTNRLQLGAYEKENWLYRAMHGRSIVFSYDLADKFTAMTYGDDVAKAISSLIGKKEALGRSFNIATEKSYTWQQILDFYLDSIERITGKKPKVVMSKETIKLKDKDYKYQVLYAKRFNRSFDNTAIKSFYTYGFIDPKVGLDMSVRTFLENPKFRGINWRYEAWSDRISKEYTPLLEIPSFMGKCCYICYRNNIGWLFEFGQYVWHKIKKQK